MTLTISLEYLYHYRCPSCDGWWSVADKHPTPGQSAVCPHCGEWHKVPEAITDGKQAVMRYSPVVERWVNTSIRGLVDDTTDQGNT